MRILITGGAGMVGSHAAEYFARKNKKNKVVILDNFFRSKWLSYNKESVEHNWQFLSRYKNITRIKGDICLKKDLNNAIGKGVDVVIHAAGQPSVIFSMTYPHIDFRINALGTLNVLEEIRKKTKEAIIIYCSTNKVYGENIGIVPLRETNSRYEYRDIKGIKEDMSTDLTGHTPYGVSKLTGDIYMQEYAKLYKIKTNIFRMSCIYGTRQFGIEEQGWLCWFIIAAILKKPIKIFGNGKQVRDVLYVTDLIRAFESCIDKPTEGEIFNIGGGVNNNVSLLEFLDGLVNLLGNRPKIEFDDWRPSDQKVYISDLTKINKTLSWSPIIDKKEGIKLLFNWIKRNINFFKDL